jgi:hypothetical protein
LEEEAGRRAGRLVPLATIWTTPGFTDERIHLFAAFDLEPVPHRREVDEVIELVRMPLDDALALVWSGELADAKSALACATMRHLGRLHRCTDLPSISAYRTSVKCSLVRRAEALGHARQTGRHGRPAARRRPGSRRLTATVALLARTSRIEIGSIRLVHQWNAARLAQAVATVECVAPGRLRFLASIGGQPGDRRFGFALPPASERIAWLDEWLAALRRLWAGERVTVDGRYVTLDDALVRPLPRGGRMPIEVGGAGARLLEVVARHADRWDLNVPPVARLVREATAHLEAACQAVGRDPTAIGRSMGCSRDPAGPPATRRSRPSSAAGTRGSARCPKRISARRSSPVPPRPVARESPRSGAISASTCRSSTSPASRNPRRNERSPTSPPPDQPIRPPGPLPTPQTHGGAGPSGPGAEIMR